MKMKQRQKTNPPIAIANSAEPELFPGFSFVGPLTHQRN
jgi:hypothetical protein